MDTERVSLEKTELQASLTDPNSSALKKYQSAIVGNSSFLYLCKYELITSLLGGLPGALGLMLRKWFYKSLFSKIGNGVVLGRNVVLRHPIKIHLGNNVIIDDNVVLDAKGSNNKGIFIGDNVMIGRNTVLSCKNGDLYIGRNTNIALNCFIQSSKEVRIGDNVLFAAYCYVIGGGDHKTDRTDIPIIAQGQVVKGITIENNCWIGAGVKIQDGVVIGRDSILGSGAVVTKSVPPFSVAVGVPASIIRTRAGLKAK